MTIGIIGGGIIGLCSAYYLQQAGHRVTVFNSGPLLDGCSMGNAGMIVPSHIVPLAQPGMIAKGMRWMLRSTSPFYIKPRLNADLLRWGWLFYQHATPEHVERSIPVLRDLSLLSKRLYQNLAQSGNVDFGWHERGLLMLYKTATAEHEMAEEADLANHAGVEALILNGQQVQDREPNTRVEVRGGVLFPGDAHLNPGQLVQSLVVFLRAQGVEVLENTPVLELQKTNGRVTALRTEAGEHPVDAVVVAGGAWSAEMARQLGLRLPLQGGKGYSFMIDGAGPSVQIPAIMLEARATATPVGLNLRFAGTLEVAGTDLRVNPNRVRGIVQSINNYYPDIPVQMPQIESVWRGLRPCSPDGLPYIGRLKTHENVVLATGHGMMGISLGPATGKLVAETLTGTQTSLDLNVFNPERFA
ncbi:MAG: FAD-dependent oxidoreductase [Cytophagales bacterium]|nr:MAG: FAD-dependent oxidoreductase [Cytophagales bacterium]